MNNQFNKKGFNELKRKRRRKGIRAYQRQVHPQKVMSPALSMLGLEAAKAVKIKKEKGI